MKEDGIVAVEDRAELNKQLAARIAVVEADLPELHRFTAGRRRDHDAVVAGRSMPPNSGAAEGTF